MHKSASLPGFSPQAPSLQSLSISPGTKQAKHDEYVMKLHRKSIVQDLILSVAHLLQRRVVGSRVRSDAKGEIEDAVLRTVRSYFKRMPLRYSLSVDPQDALTHLTLMDDARKVDKPRAHLKVVEDEDEEEGNSADIQALGFQRTIVTVACRDSPKLLDLITAELRRRDARILDADVMTSTDGFALDRFEVLMPADFNLSVDDLQKSIECLIVHAVAPREGCPAEPQLGTVSAVLEGEEEEEEEDSKGRGLSSGLTAALRSLHLIPFRDLDFLAPVGQGRFSRTFQARLGGKLVAVKSISVQDGEGGASDGTQHGAYEMQLALGEFHRELEVVKDLSHPHICAFIGVSVGGPYHCIVFEYLEGGTLTKYLRGRNPVPSAGERIRVANEIAEGMLYLHSQGIVHRDLKSSNILLDGQDRVRIVDFGLSCAAQGGADLTAETGTYRWMAPEVIRHEPYSFPADVYSFGIILWEMVVRKQPFEGMTPIQAAFAVARQGLRPQIPETTPPSLARLIRQCWIGNPQARPFFKDIISAMPLIKLEIEAFDVVGRGFGVEDLDGSVS